MNRSRSLNPAVVVLAAGFSSRLGRNKALVRIHGSTALRTLLFKLAPLTDCRVAVVVPRRSATLREARRYGGRHILNPDPGRGMSSSVRCALQQLRYSPAVLILPVDLSQLRRRELAAMIRRWYGHRRKLIARRDGQRALTPMIIPKHLFHLAAQIGGDVGLRDLIATLPVEERILLDVPSAAVDLDTQIDLDSARRRYGNCI